MITCSGKRSISHAHYDNTYKTIKEQVLNEERKYAYATTIDEINTYFIGCEACTWYKSDEAILSQVRSQNKYPFFLEFLHRIPTLAGRVGRSFISMTN